MGEGGRTFAVGATLRGQISGVRGAAGPRGERSGPGTGREWHVRSDVNIRLVVDFWR